MFVCVRVPASWVLSCTFFAFVSESAQSSGDWRVLYAWLIFKKIDKMSPVWKLPIYKPSSRNFRETPVPSKSEQELRATSGSEVKNPWQAKWHLTKGFLLAL